MHDSEAFLSSPLNKEQHYVCNYIIKQVYISTFSSKKLYFKLKVGHKKFYSTSAITTYSSAELPTASKKAWKTPFVTALTPHSFLFSSIIVDLFEKSFFFDNRYIARGQTKLSHLQDKFKELLDSSSNSIELRLELFKFSDCPSNSCLLKKKYFPPAAIGWIDIILVVTPHERDEDYRCDCIGNSEIINEIEREMLTEIEFPPMIAELSQKTTLYGNGVISSQTYLSQESFQFGSELQIETLFQLNIFKKDNTMKVVKSMLREISDGAMFTRRQFFENILFLQRVYTKYIPRRVEIAGNLFEMANTETVDFVQVNRCWKFVVASFGTKGIISSKNDYTGTIFQWVMQSFREEYDVKQGEYETICKYLSLQPSDILDMKLRIEDNILRPCFYIADDIAHKAIRLVIRGTMNASDVLLDLLYQYHPWKDSYVHFGIMKAAKWCFDNLGDYLIAESSARKYKKLFVVGHSLGGAVASLFTIMMSEVHPTFSIECIAFGPPPTISLPLASAYDNLIKVFIYENDLVPSLCFGSVVQMKEIMLACRQPLPSTACCNPENFEKENDLIRYSKLDRILENRIQVLNMSIPKLYLPGRIFHLIGRRESSKVEPKYDVYETTRDLYSEICLRKEYLMDHMLNGYTQSLEILSRNSANQ